MHITFMSQKLIAILEHAITHKSLPLTKVTHAHILTNNLQQNPYVTTKLITAYAQFHNPKNSTLIFNSLIHKTIFTHNTLLSTHVKNRNFNQSLKLFNAMCQNPVIGFDEFTLSAVLKSCAEANALKFGKGVHAKSVKSGYSERDAIVGNSVMVMYSKCGEFGECLRFFDEMGVGNLRNSGSWNVVIAGFAGRNCGGEVFGVFRGMLSDGVRPSGFTVSSVFPFCDGRDGKGVHCWVLRNGLDSVLGSDVHLGCCLVDMYSRNGEVRLGRRVFERMRRRNVFAWTAMVNGYVRDGDFEEALVVFRGMWVRDGIEPNRVSLVSVLPACSSLAELMLGKQVHGFAIRREFDGDVPLCNAMIDMYAKCGNLAYARRVFDGGFFSKDVISWGSMICGYGLHGEGREAVLLYEKMVQLGIKPDAITLVGVLSACSRSGLVDEGLKIYGSAINDNGLEPTQEICSCVVDMLGQSGQLDQAFEFIKAMPVEPGPSVWGSLIRVSEVHGNSEMRDLAHRSLVQVEPENPSNYVGLSNLYASSEKWDVAAQVRTLMKDRGLKKAPGSTRITVSC